MVLMETHAIPNRIPITEMGYIFCFFPEQTYTGSYIAPWSHEKFDSSQTCYRISTTQNQRTKQIEPTTTKHTETTCKNAFYNSSPRQGCPHQAPLGVQVLADEQLPECQEPSRDELPREVHEEREIPYGGRSTTSPPRSLQISV